MTSALIGATVLVVLYSLWVRRDTWWSRWEVAITTAIALEGCAVVLLSPWAARAIGTACHRITGVWNLQQLVGHLCIVIAISLNAYHVLLRLADHQRIRPMFRRHAVWPVGIGMSAMVVIFVVADADYRPHGLSTGGDGNWTSAYWVVLCGLLLYQSGYAMRLLLMVRSDPRAKETVELFTASSAFAVAAIVATLSATWSDADVSPLIWLCVSLSVGIFAYGAARSWQAKAAWFTAGHRVNQHHPPQTLS